jgi:hypothetical protein
MSWEHRKPDGVGEIERLGNDQFRVSVSMPSSDDGYFGRECPECERPFKMRDDEYEALPDDLVLTCPYCGHANEHSEFMTAAQRDRAMAAAKQIALQYAHDQINAVLGQAFGGQGASPRSGFGIGVRYEPGRPPPIRDLPDFVEKETRRIIDCGQCRNHHAVYGASGYCPVCGARPAIDKVVDAIDAARAGLSLEDRLNEDEREALAAVGAFERIAVDAIKSSVTLFEMFAREQFLQRVDDADRYVKGTGNVFQRLDEAADLFKGRAALDLVAMVGEERWKRLRRVFADRHVLTHNDGVVDEKYLTQVPQTKLQLGQRVVVTRLEAQGALNDLEALVRAIAGA